MLPTLRQLHYLKLLAEQGSFGRAAEAAHVTQPTLSSGIQELERTLGAPVVDRARSGVILTAVGEEALRRATVILNEAEELVEAAKNAGQPLTGRFRLGVIPTIAPFLLPRALPALRERFPKLRLFLREDLTQRLIAALKAGQLDAALIALPYDMAGLNWAHVSDDELLAAMPADHPLAKLKSTDPAAFEDEDLILLEDGHCLREHALAACGLKPPRTAVRGGGFCGHVPPDPGADGGLGPGGHLPAGNGGERRAHRSSLGRHPPHRPRRTRPARSLSPGGPAPTAPPRGGCWRRCCGNENIV